MKDDMISKQNRAAILFLLSAILVVALPHASRAADGDSQAVCDSTADVSLGEENYGETIRVHQEILRRDPGNALAHYHLGFAYSMTNNTGAELREYERAQQLGLRQWDFFLNLGILRLERNELSLALDALDAAAKIGPQHPEAHFNLGLAYERAGFMAEAANEVALSLKLEPGQLDAQNELAAIYAQMGDYGRARAMWTELAVAHPEYVPGVKNLKTLKEMTIEAYGLRLAKR
jgi:tetratricopeptide (TPR) repeat protein